MVRVPIGVGVERITVTEYAAGPPPVMARVGTDGISYTLPQVNGGGCIACVLIDLPNKRPSTEEVAYLTANIFHFCRK